MSQVPQIKQKLLPGASQREKAASSQYVEVATVVSSGDAACPRCVHSTEALGCQQPGAPRAGPL